MNDMRNDQGDTGIRAVLFDLGGVYYTEGFRDGLFAIARRLGLSPADVYQAGVDAIHGCGYLTGGAPEIAFWRDLASRIRTGEDLSGFRQVILDSFEPRPGMRELVAEVRLSLPVGLLTDQTNWLYELDARDGFLCDFDAVISSYEEGYSKRDTEIFRIACSRLGVFPEEALFFDDNEGNVGMAAEFGLQPRLFTDVPSTIRELILAGAIRAKRPQPVEE